MTVDAKPSKPEKAPLELGQVKITAKGRVGTYVSYATKLLNEDKMDTITLLATGTALNICVTTAEILKRRFKGLHQLTKIGTLEIEDEWKSEKKEDQVAFKRRVSFMDITLTTDDGKVDKSDKGYQTPLPEELVKEIDESAEEAASRPRRGRGKGKGKGKKGSKKSSKSGKRGKSNASGAGEKKKEKPAEGGEKKESGRKERKGRGKKGSKKGVWKKAEGADE